MFFIKEELKVKRVIDSCNSEDQLLSCVEWINNMKHRMEIYQKVELDNCVLNKQYSIEIKRIEDENNNNNRKR